MSASPPLYIDNCTELNTTGTTYILTSDVIDANITACMNITANNVTLDCQGHVVDGVLGSGSTGVLIERQTLENAGIEILNCTLTDWEDSSIKTVNGANLTIKTVTIKKRDGPGQGSYGLYLKNVENATIENITIIGATSDTAIYLTNSKNTNITSAVLTSPSNIGVGIYNSNNITVKNFTMTGGGIRGIEMSRSTVTIEDSLVSEAIYGIAFLDGNTVASVTNTTVNESGMMDLYFAWDLGHCNNRIENVTGTGGLPIGFYTTRVHLKNQEYSELVLCGADDSIVENTTVTGHGNNGLLVYQGTNITIKNTTTRNMYYGIMLYYSDNCLVVNNTMTDTVYPLYIRSSHGANITRNRITQENRAPYGLHVYNTQSGARNLIYDNLFNTTTNIDTFSFQTINTSWNTTPTTRMNVLGQPALGGNYWGAPDGTGFSDTCNDTDLDGYCDDPYSFSGDTDYHPLSGRLEIVVIGQQEYTDWPDGGGFNVTSTVWDRNGPGGVENCTLYYTTPEASEYYYYSKKGSYNNETGECVSNLSLQDPLAVMWAWNTTNETRPYNVMVTDDNYTYIETYSNRILVVDNNNHGLSYSISPGPTGMSIAIDGGYIYAGMYSTTNTVKKYYKNGTLADQSPVLGEIVYSLGVDNESIYLGADSGNLTRINKTNMSRVLWTTNSGATIYDLAVGGESVYIGNGNGLVRKVNKTDNATIWEATISPGRIQALILYHDSVWAGDSAGTLYELNKTTGDLLWNSTVTNGSIIDLKNDTLYIYAGTDTGEIIRTDPTTHQTELLYHLDSRGSETPLGSPIPLVSISVWNDTIQALAGRAGTQFSLLLVFSTSNSTKIKGGQETSTKTVFTNTRSYTAETGTSTHAVPPLVPYSIILSITTHPNLTAPGGLVSISGRVYTNTSRTIGNTPIGVYIDGTPLYYNETTRMLDPNGNVTPTTNSTGHYYYETKAPESTGEYTLLVNVTDENGRTGSNTTILAVVLESHESGGSSGGDGTSGESGGTSIGGFYSPPPPGEGELVVLNKTLYAEIERGMSKRFRIFVLNNGSAPLFARVSIEGNTSLVCRPEPEEIEVDPGNTGTVTLSVSTDNTTREGLYSGWVFFDDNHTKEMVRVDFVVRAEKELYLEVWPLNNTLREGEALSVVVNLTSRNMGNETFCNVTLELWDLEEERIVSSKTIVMSLREGVSRIALEMPGNTTSKTYLLKARAAAIGIPVDTETQTIIDMKITKFGERETPITLLGLVIFGLVISLAFVSWLATRKKGGMFLGVTMGQRPCGNVKEIPRGKRSIFLGCTRKGEPFFLDPVLLKGGIAIVGGPDTGKTTIGMVIVEDLLRDGWSVIVLDSKGDWVGFMRECKTFYVLERYIEFKTKRALGRTVRGRVHVLREEENQPLKISPEPSVVDIVVLPGEHPGRLAGGLGLVRFVLERTHKDKILVVVDGLETLDYGTKEEIERVRVLLANRSVDAGLVLIGERPRGMVEAMGSGLPVVVVTRTRNRDERKTIGSLIGREASRLTAGLDVGECLVVTRKSGSVFFQRVKTRDILSKNMGFPPDGGIEKYVAYAQRLERARRILDQLKTRGIEIPHLEEYYGLAEEKVVHGRLDDTEMSLVDIYLDEIERAWSEKNPTQD